MTARPEVENIDPVLVAAVDTFVVKFGPGRTATFTQPGPLPLGQAGPFGRRRQRRDVWYSYNLCAWHIITLKVECALQPGGGDPNGAW